MQVSAGSQVSLKVEDGKAEDKENDPPDFIDRIWARVMGPIIRYRTLFMRANYLIMIACWFIYFGFAMACRLDDEGSIRLLGIRLQLFWRVERMEMGPLKLK